MNTIVPRIGDDVVFIYRHLYPQIITPLILLFLYSSSSFSFSLLSQYTNDTIVMIMPSPNRMTPMTTSTKSQIRTIPESGSLRKSSCVPPACNSHNNLSVSPVNENGSFEFDRVLKSGKVYRRTRNKHVSSWLFS